jgi:hypothetical protein
MIDIFKAFFGSPKYGQINGYQLSVLGMCVGYFSICRQQQITIVGIWSKCIRPQLCFLTFRTCGILRDWYPLFGGKKGNRCSPRPFLSPTFFGLGSYTWHSSFCCPRRRIWRGEAPSNPAAVASWTSRWSARTFPLIPSCAQQRAGWENMQYKKRVGDNFLTWQSRHLCFVHLCL